MRQVLLNCDQVFDVLTRGPFPSGSADDDGVEHPDSADSRVPLWEEGLGGPVPWENIGGRAEFITFSLDGTTVWWNPLTWFDAFRSGRAGKSLRNS